MRHRDLPRRVGVHVLLLAVALFSALPFLWMITTSLKPPGVLYEPPVLIPVHFEWQNYAEAMSAAPFPRFFWNSAVMTVGITLAQTLFSAMAGYAFARLRFPGRNTLFLIVLGTMMIPFPVTLIPSFRIVAWLGWLDTYQALIAPQAVSAFAILLFRQFFLGIPRELEDAARLDSASLFATFWKIALPLSRPAIGASAVFSFLFAWNDFLWPLVVTTSPSMQTIQVGLAVFSGRYGTFWTLLAAASVVATLPSVIAFLLAQRQFVAGIVQGGLKE